MKDEDLTEKVMESGTKHGASSNKRVGFV